MEESEVDLLKAPGRKGDKCPNLYFSLSSPTTRATMNNPPPPANTWPLQPNQPFYIQTAFVPAIYNPSTGAWCPIFAAQHPQAAQLPPPAQPNLLTPAVNPPSAAASPSSPPPQPSTSAVPQIWSRRYRYFQSKNGGWGLVSDRIKFVPVRRFTKTSHPLALY
eukprot:scaffold196762_cov39-Cyclotella_meneghiniana.AAC.3